MRAVGVRQLRQNLSVYLRRVVAGESLEVTDRGHAVAVLNPLRAGCSALDRLVAAGRVRGPKGDVLALGPAIGKRPSRVLSRALDEVRGERL